MLICEGSNVSIFIPKQEHFRIFQNVYSIKELVLRRFSSMIHLTVVFIFIVKSFKRNNTVKIYSKHN